MIKINRQAVTLSSLIALSTLVFLISDTQGGVGPFISIFLKASLTWNSEQIGIALATYNIAAFICQIPSGLLIDRVKFKRSLIAISTAMVAFGCLIIVNSRSIFPILLAQSLIGIATSIIPPAIAAITLGLVGRKVFPSRLAINATFNHAGNVTNTFFNGLMAYLLGLAWILYVDVVFSVVSIIPIFMIKKNEINNEIAREAPDKLSKDYKPLPVKQILTTPIIILYGIAIILFTFANTAQLPLVGQKIANQIPELGAFYMASSIILAQIVMIGVAYSLSYFINRVGRKPLFMASFFVLIIRALLYTKTDNPHLLLLNQILDGLAAGIYSIVSVVIISDLAKDTGRFNFMQGVMIFCNNVGAAFSNLVSGFIAQLYGINTSLLMLGGIALFGLIFYWKFMPETKDKIFSY
jgi:MFS family permease